MHTVIPLAAPLKRSACAAVPTSAKAENLSFKLVGNSPATCSIVMGTTDDTPAHTVAFGTALNTLANATSADIRNDVTFRGTSVGGGITYINAFTSN